MKRFYFFISCLLLVTGIHAQTKRIEHRSHSGSNASFDLTNSSNFGVVPHHFSQQSAIRIDSLIRRDSIYMHWQDSLYKADQQSRVHAANTPAPAPRPGMGAAAGAAAGTRITSR